MNRQSPEHHFYRQLVTTQDFVVGQYIYYDGPTIPSRQARLDARNYALAQLYLSRWEKRHCPSLEDQLMAVRREKQLISVLASSQAGNWGPMRSFLWEVAGHCGNSAKIQALHELDENSKADRSEEAVFEKLAVSVLLKS